MQELIEEFLISMRAENVSPHTVKAYQADLTAYMHFAANRQDRLDDRLRAYLGVLVQGHKSASIARKMASLKSFFRWQKAEGLIQENPVEVIRLPRRRFSLPHVPSREEIEILLSSPPSNSAFPERDLAMLRVLYDTGIRAAELTNIRLQDIQFPDVIRIFGKGKKERLVLFGERTAAALAAYLPVRERRLKDRRGNLQTDLLFFGLHGRSTGRLETRSLGRIVHAACDDKGLPPMHPHSFRHAFGTHMIDNDADLPTVSKLMGHTNLTTTMEYLRLSMSTVFRQYKAARAARRR